MLKRFGLTTAALLTALIMAQPNIASAKDRDDRDYARFEQQQRDHRFDRDDRDDREHRFDRDDRERGFDRR